MKTRLTILATLISILSFGQDNKRIADDFGIRYSIIFNGGAAQALTFSGMITNRWEVGSTINVQYSQSTDNNTGIDNVYVGTAGEEVPGLETTTNSMKTINISLSPFLAYHMPIHSNLDIYTGVNLLVGTGAITLSNNSSDVVQAPGYSYQSFNSVSGPLGYSIGGGAIIGGQYFFYKKLALGVSANLAAVYTGRKGTQTTSGSYSYSNTGSTPYSSSETYYTPINSHSFSLTSNSGVGVTLTFYVGTKRKAKAEEKKTSNN